MAATGWRRFRTGASWRCALAGARCRGLVWHALGIDTGPHEYHLTNSALAQAYRPLNAGLLLVWILIGIGYGAARARAPVHAAGPDSGGGSPKAPDHGETFPLAASSLVPHHGTTALLLPQSTGIGVTFWLAVPVVAVAIDVRARRSHGRSATSEEIVRFLSTAPLANVALIAAWLAAGYHLFAR